MRKQRPKGQVKKQKQKLQDNTHHLSPLRHAVINQPPPYLSHPPIICNNNTINIEFLVQMRQLDK